MHPIHLSAIPILGLLKNIIKRKQYNIALFFRTPAIYIVFFRILKFFRAKNIISKIIIYERIFLFLIKIFLALYTKNFERKRLKYEIKYSRNN